MRCAIGACRWRCGGCCAARRPHRWWPPCSNSRWACLMRPPRRPRQQNRNPRPRTRPCGRRTGRGRSTPPTRWSIRRWRPCARCRRRWRCAVLSMPACAAFCASAWPCASRRCATRRRAGTTRSGGSSACSAATPNTGRAY